MEGVGRSFLCNAEAEAQAAKPQESDSSNLAPGVTKARKAEPVCILIRPDPQDSREV